MATASRKLQVSNDVEEAISDMWLLLPKIIGDQGRYGVGADMPPKLHRKYAERIHNDRLFRRAVEDDIEAIFSKEKVEWPNYLTISWGEIGPTFDTDGDACGIGYFYGGEGISDHNIDYFAQASILFIALSSYLRRYYTAIGTFENPLENNFYKSELERPIEILERNGRTIQVGKGRSLYSISPPRESLGPYPYYGSSSNEIGLKSLGSFIPCIEKTEDGYRIIGRIIGRIIDTDKPNPARRFRTPGFMGFYEDLLKKMVCQHSDKNEGPSILEIDYKDDGVSFTEDGTAKLSHRNDEHIRWYVSEGITTLPQATVLLVAFILFLRYADMEDETDEKTVVKEPCTSRIELR